MKTYMYKETDNMKIISKKTEELNFVESGVEGIYVLDRIAFIDMLDEHNGSDWEKSTGKQRLLEWAQANLPSEILQQYYVDIPMFEEVFSQKYCDRYFNAETVTSRQWPIFKNSDHRMICYDGKLTVWWTQPIKGRLLSTVSCVNSFGMIDAAYPCFKQGFVPVLRKKILKTIADITVAELAHLCDGNCKSCQLANVICIDGLIHTNILKYRDIGKEVELKR